GAEPTRAEERARRNHVTGSVMSTPESRRSPANPRFVTKSIFLPISEQRDMFTPFRCRLLAARQPLRGGRSVRDLPLHEISEFGMPARQCGSPPRLPLHFPPRSRIERCR